jgi:glycopeptide antibiotics resistance protein
MKRFLNLQNLVIISCVVISIIASLTDVAFIQGIYFNIGNRTIFMNNYSHIIFFAILGIIFRKYGITFLRGLAYITLFTTSLELLQTFTPSRNVDIEDILSGIIGWLSGFLLLTIYELFVKREDKKCVH